MITSPQNQRVKDIRRLRRCKGDLAVLEGPHLLAEASRSDLPLAEVFVTPDFAASREGRELLGPLPTPPTRIDGRVLRAITDADSPQGVLAVARLPRGGVEEMPRAKEGLWIYADGLQDPGNLGALARVAEAAGAHGLALSTGCAHPNHPRALRASAGSLLRLPTARAVSPEALTKHLQELLPRWACLVPRDGTNLYQADLTRPLVLAVGAEGPGLSTSLVESADLRITIPLAAPVESLNATVAAALALFEVARPRT